MIQRTSTIITLFVMGIVLGNLGSTLTKLTTPGQPMYAVGFFLIVQAVVLGILAVLMWMARRAKTADHPRVLR